MTALLMGVLLVKAWVCGCKPVHATTHHWSHRQTWFFRKPQARIHCTRCGETTRWMNER